MRRYLTTAVGALVFAGCAARDNDAANDTATTDSPAAATAADPGVSATMRDASGRELGTLRLTDATGGISVSGTLRGLPPGEHGLHIHMVARCDPPTFESAGEHWNPTSRQHGTENPQGPHFGDLPNVTVGADSTTTVQGTTAGGSLRGSDMLLDTDGAAVIIHTSPDDNKTDPSGSSGARIACAAVSGR